MVKNFGTVANARRSVESRCYERAVISSSMMTAVAQDAGNAYSQTMCHCLAREMIDVRAENGSVEINLCQPDDSKN